MQKLHQVLISKNWKRNLALNPNLTFIESNIATTGAFTPKVKSMLSENLGHILGGTKSEMGHYLILSEC